MTETDEMYARYLRDKQLNPEPLVEYAIQQARTRGDDSYTYWSEDRGLVTVTFLQFTPEKGQ